MITILAAVCLAIGLGIGFLWGFIRGCMYESLQQDQECGPRSASYPPFGVQREGAK